jgi:hypothetical protein
MVGGGLFVTVGVAGVLAGLWASRDVQSKVPEEVAISMPAKAHAATVPTVAEGQVNAAAQLQAKPKPPAHHAPPAAGARHSPPPPKPELAQLQRAEDVPEIPTEQVAALASEAEEAPAAMPLPSFVIARTIGRIGYSCGAVSSTTAVEGSRGVFKVTCTSGDTYKATPVNGRYHFRRWGG